jgi:hypothetical protein
MLFMSGALAHHHETRRPLETIQMKRFLIIGAVLVGSVLVAITAHAHLGDSYAVAARGLRTLKPHTVRDWVVWNSEDDTKSSVWMQFHNNECVAVYYKTNDIDHFIVESEVWRLLNLTRNRLKPDAYWEEAPKTIEGCRQFYSSDGSMATLLESSNLWLRIAYRDWLERHHLIYNPEGKPSEQHI